MPYKDLFGVHWCWPLTGRVIQLESLFSKNRKTGVCQKWVTVRTEHLWEEPGETSVVDDCSSDMPCSFELHTWTVQEVPDLLQSGLFLCATSSSLTLVSCGVWWSNWQGDVREFSHLEHCRTCLMRAYECYQLWRVALSFIKEIRA